MRIRKLIFRWSLVTGSLIALFWTIWYLVAGDVPTITSIELAKNWVYILPFEISRWWDILIGPVWSTAIILLLTNKRSEEDKELILSLVVGLGTGLVVGLGTGLVVGLGTGLVVGLVVGLGVGLVVGLVVGLGFGLVFSLVVGLGTGLCFLTKSMPNTNAWIKIWDWLLVR